MPPSVEPSPNSDLPVMRRLRHLANLLGEITRYSLVNRVWWPVPLIGTLLVLGLVVVVGQASAPFIYTLF